LSSAGKTTLAKAVSEGLCARGYETEWLDGDEIRQSLCRDLGFSKEDRDENIRRIGFVADLLTRHGVVVLVSAISPYRAARDEVRGRVREFLEVHVRAPLDICERRDMHGIYRRARTGELSHVAGIDDPYEAPLAPEVECCTDQETPTESKRKILQAIEAWFAQRMNALRPSTSPGPTAQPQ
jgi:adenylyl-sulfate kinase